MTPKQKRHLLLVIAACAAAGSVAADEDFDPEPVIEGRQSALRDIGAAFKGITDEFKRPTPSLSAIRQYAHQIDDLAKYQQRWFPVGTGPESEIETAARPEIWRQPAEFQAAQKMFGEQAVKLAQIADGNDLGAIKTQWQALGRTCKGCHEKFREKDD